MWDAIVIGAGISGCSVARELARYKLKVLVLEKGHDLCAGTTRGNSATVHAGYDPDPGSNKAIYNVRGSRMYEDLGHIRREQLRSSRVSYLHLSLIHI